MLKVLRYSKDGFKPQRQTNHYDEELDYMLNHFDINSFPKHLQMDNRTKYAKEISIF